MPWHSGGAVRCVALDFGEIAVRLKLAEPLLDSALFEAGTANNLLDAHKRFARDLVRIIPRKKAGDAERQE
jgi:hypothetical protein